MSRSLGLQFSIYARITWASIILLYSGVDTGELFFYPMAARVATRDNGEKLLVSSALC